MLISAPYVEKNWVFFREQNASIYLNNVLQFIFDNESTTQIFTKFTFSKMTNKQKFIKKNIIFF